MQAVLVMFRAGGERRSFSITRDVTVIGRREDCDLRIPVGEVSRKHCRILRDGDAIRLEDLGSSNGTFHNGQRVQTVELQPGDSLQVGPVVFVVQIDGVPPDDELQPFTQAKAKNLSDSVAPGEPEGEGSVEALNEVAARNDGVTSEMPLEVIELAPAEETDENQAFAVANDEPTTEVDQNLNVDFGSEEAT